MFCLYQIRIIFSSDLFQKFSSTITLSLYSMNISVLIRYTFWPVSCQKKDVQSKMYNMNQQLYSPSNAAHMIQIYLVRPFPTYALHNRYLYYHFKNAYNCIFVAFFFCTPSTTLCQDNWYYPKDICMNVDNIYTIIAFMSNQMRRKSSHSYLLGGIRIIEFAL